MVPVTQGSPTHCVPGYGPGAGKKQPKETPVCPHGPALHRQIRYGQEEFHTLGRRQMKTWKLSRSQASGGDLEKVH